MLVWRRAVSARSLLLAAALAALIATAMLAGLAEYSRTVIVDGARSAVSSAPVSERALLVQGQGKPGAEAALRGAVPGWRVHAGGYATGRQFTGPTGAAQKDANGVVYASVMFIEGLRDSARLISGEWAKPGADPPQAMLGEAAANTLGVKAGDTLPILDRRTDAPEQIKIAGIFAANDAQDGLWLLTPELASGAGPSGTTYGPLVLDRADFERGWQDGGSAGWVAEPDLTKVSLDDLLALRTVARDLPQTLPTRMGMGSSGQATTRLDLLVDRIQRADLVGRSALLTPLLLIVVLGGYALLLLAGLLTEQRRSETALLRARGADGKQLAALAFREGLLIVVPAVLIVSPFVTAGTWLVTGAAGVGCLLAITAPALRRGATYVDELTARKRQSFAQRAGIDLALVALAVLAWTQLRQYSSPLAGVGGQLGIDPLLAAAAPIGVLAASVVALRLLPPLTRIAERFIDRRNWFAAQMGMWQAGRRPHAGPVLLLALAVAVSTLAWALAGTAQRSQVDQADHLAGADLRLSETSGFAPAGRTEAVAKLPGIKEVVPGWRLITSLGEKSTRSTLLGLDVTKAATVIRMRPDLGDAGQLFADLAAQRGKGFKGAIASAAALEVLHKKVGERVRLPLGRGDIEVLLLHSVDTLPGTDGGPAVLIDLPSLEGFRVTDWWIATDPASHSQAAAAAQALANIRVYDRIALASQASQDPYGVGARWALFIAALGAVALALVGVAVDVRATARRRMGEMAVLHTLGATPRMLARSLVTEQGFLAGLGIGVGMAVGLGVAATMAPLVILTPSAARPDPEPLLHLDWRPVVGTAAGLLLLAMGMAAMIATSMRQRLIAARLRVGAE